MVRPEQGELFPAAPVQLALDEDGRVINIATEDIYDVDEAIDAIPWVSQTCPLMPHEYATQRACPDLSWPVLMAWLKGPESYAAFFRGYQRPNRYRDHSDGYRYWRTSSRRTQMVNRCSVDFEPPRRVAHGAVPFRWDGPPWAPNGTDLYYFASGTWLPKPDSGLTPCAGCRRASTVMGRRVTRPARGLSSSGPPETYADGALPTTATHEL